MIVGFKVCASMFRMSGGFVVLALPLKNGTMQVPNVVTSGPFQKIVDVLSDVDDVVFFLKPSNGLVTLVQFALLDVLPAMLIEL